MSSYLPSYGGAGLIPPVGRGTMPHGGGPAPSEVSVGSSFSQRSSTCPGRSEADPAPPVGRGLALGRGQRPLQNPIIGKDS